MCNSSQPISVYVMFTLSYSCPDSHSFGEWVRIVRAYALIPFRSISTSPANTIKKTWLHVLVHTLSLSLRFLSWSCSLECHSNWKLTSIFSHNVSKCIWFCIVNVCVCVCVCAAHAHSVCLYYILVNRSSMFCLNFSVMACAWCLLHRMHLGKSATPILCLTQI